MATQTPLVMTGGQVKRLASSDTIPEMSVGSSHTYSGQPGAGIAYSLTVSNITALLALTKLGNNRVVRVTTGLSGYAELWIDMWGSPSHFWYGPLPGYFANAPYKLGQNAEDHLIIPDTIQYTNKPDWWWTPSGAPFDTLPLQSRKYISDLWRAALVVIDATYPNVRRAIHNRQVNDRVWVLGVGQGPGLMFSSYFSSTIIPPSSTATYYLEDTERFSTSALYNNVGGYEITGAFGEHLVPVSTHNGVFRKLRWFPKDNVTFSVPGDVPASFVGTARRYFHTDVDYNRWIVGVSQPPATDLTISVMKNGTLAVALVLPAGQYRWLQGDPDDTWFSISIKAGDYITINTSGATVKDLVVTME